jgi:hypothetical protein
MPRCPLCGSAHITIVASLRPHAFCSRCGARWSQDGSQQQAVKQGPGNPHSWPRPDSPGRWPSPATTPLHARPQQLPARFVGTSPW